MQWKTDAVHQIVEFILQRFNNFYRYKEMCFVQIQQNKLFTKCLFLIQMQQKLFHGRIARIKPKSYCTFEISVSKLFFFLILYLPCNQNTFDTVNHAFKALEIEFGRCF